MEKDMNNIDETVNAKLTDIDVPGAAVEMDPDEADLAGAFQEDALSPDDALEASSDAREGEQ
jgi:type IV secretion system protein VirB1